MANILSCVLVIDYYNFYQMVSVENLADHKITSLTPVLCWFSPPLVAISKQPFDDRSRTASRFQIGSVGESNK